jgi:ATP-dependent DNA helicase RecG
VSEEPLPVRFGGGRFQRRPQAPRFTLHPERLATPLTSVASVGTVTARRLAGLGLRTVGDLLEHYPRRYDDYSQRACLGELRLGQEASVRVIVERAELVPTRRRGLQVVRATVRDGSGVLEALWFNQGYLARVLEPGMAVSLRGSLRSRGGRPALLVKSHELLGIGEDALHTEGVVPIYPASEEVSARLLRTLVHRALPLARCMPDPMPVQVRLGAHLPARCDALMALHAPRSLADGGAARERFVFEELYLLQVGLLLHKAAEARRATAARLDGPPRLSRSFLEQLPFSLTEYQRAAIRELDADLASETPMRRLLQGDVGSGKTVVALYALVRAVEHGRQGALMAPTETLAAQHLATVRELVGGLAHCELLSAGLPAARRRQTLAGLADGSVQLAVGTHALLSEGAVFKDLGVVVVDEQHRFGVVQRDELARRAAHGGVTPHLLYMTATPIPRTLALTLYGDLDVTVIAGGPAGRTPVRTRVVSDRAREKAYAFTRRQLDAGRQAYVVCPTIEESESLSAAAAVAEAERLRGTEFVAYRLAVLHGQMRSAERQTVMEAFKAGEIRVLVATSVIEVGIDVPNATVMIVEGAERFGLAQLHQLRGRVGRGSAKSFCLLFSQAQTAPAKARLRALVQTTDGFELADRDLEIRGEGQLFGARQSGLPDLKLARLLRDRETLKAARAAAQRTLQDDPALVRPESAPLLDAVQAAFGDELAWLLRA